MNFRGPFEDILNLNSCKIRQRGSSKKFLTFSHSLQVIFFSRNKLTASRVMKNLEALVFGLPSFIIPKIPFRSNLTSNDSSSKFLPYNENPFEVKIRNLIHHNKKITKNLNFSFNIFPMCDVAHHNKFRF